ncbi:hypothetical protein GWI33_022501 [Rhynchophorus ferrugineus]|uniref:Uncharacterized protein n=1 Tax=Rhynchophorus ferrugineus TaxID=354439 RepID=A0A834MMI4_RHYFE|nr:hypothetical protein GWI33_022501 [Rhynchophorus ferrugineus]
MGEGVREMFREAEAEERGKLVRAEQKKYSTTIIPCPADLQTLADINVRARKGKYAGGREDSRVAFGGLE